MRKPLTLTQQEPERQFVQERIPGGGIKAYLFAQGLVSKIS
jgi:hypothetical protein